MFAEKRREDRDRSEISVSLQLRNREDEEAICLPFKGLVANMSSYGACILMDKIREGSSHLFYTPRDNITCALFLEISSSDNDSFSIPVWPVWFDRLLWEKSKPFQVGVEFLLHPHDEQVENFKKLMHQQGKHESLKEKFNLGKTA